MNALVYALFLASGAAGLIYQVAWIRVSSQASGVTVYSATVVTAVFMAGLGLGSYLSGVWADRHPRRALRTYGAAEVAIGLLGLALALSLPHLDALMAGLSWYGAPDPRGWRQLALGSSVLRYGLVALLLLPSTFLMGATLPLLVRHVVAGHIDLAGHRIGWLYGLNTLGAALGSFATDLWLVPGLGLRGSQLVAVGINLLVGVGALAAERRIAPVEVEPSPERDDPADASATRRARSMAGALFCFGAVALGLEVVWFRFLIGSMGTYRAVISLVLTVMLVCIGVGAALGGWLQRRLSETGAALAPAEVLIITQALMVAIAMASLATFDPNWSNRLLDAMVDPGSGRAGWASQYAAMLPPTASVVALPSLLMGASYPLANAHVQREGGRVGRSAGLLYLGNTAGNVLGAVAGGFVLLPHLGSQGTLLVLAVVGTVGIGLTLISSRDPDGEASASRGFAIGLSIVVIVTLVWAAALPTDHLMRRQLPLVPEGSELIAAREGLHETIAVIENPQGDRTLWTNRHSMSATHIAAQRYMRAFAHIPLLQVAEPERALVICFGVGSTVHAASLHPLERLEVVDLSVDVLEHAGHFEPNHHGVLADPRLSVFINDGRQHLRMTDHRYDLITLEPPPITAAGIASLYSVEFYRLAKARLSDGGFLSQWLPIYQVNEDVALQLVAAFVEVFPNAVLLSGHQKELILLGRHGADNTIDPSAVQRHLKARPRVARDLARIRLATPVELVGTFVGDAETARDATAEVTPLRDDRPTMEHSRVSHVTWTELPLQLFATERVARWCPTCFRDGQPIEALAGLPDYLAVLDAFYRSSELAVHTSLDHDAPPATFDEDMHQTILEQPYLRAMLGPRLGPRPQPR